MVIIIQNNNIVTQYIVHDLNHTESYKFKISVSHPIKQAKSLWDRSPASHASNKIITVNHMQRHQY